MAEHDDSVEKLEAFCRLLAGVNDGLRADTDTLETRGGELRDTSDDIEDGLEGLGQDLDDLRRELEQGEDEASRALEQASQAARRAQDEVEKDEKDLDDAGQTFGERMDAQRAELTGADASLHAEGVEPLEQSLAEVGQGLQSTDQRTQSAFDELRSAMATEEARIEQAAAEAEAAIAEDAAALQQAAASLESEGESCAVAWREEVPSPWEQAYEAVAETLVGEYQELDATTIAAVGALLQSIEQYAVVAAETLAMNVTSPLVEKAITASGNVSRYAGGLSYVQGQAESQGGALAAELEPLALELAKARQIMPVVDELIDAI